MTKSEYLKMNYDAVVYNTIKPFKNIDTVEKGLYNYQYYNALAKENRSIGSCYGNEFEIKKEYIEKSDYYYRKKDKATLKVLKLLDYKGVEAYFVKVHSKNLKGKLFEIVLDDYNMILHSTSEVIRNLLIEEEVFYNESRISVIDGYINQRY